MQQLQQQQPWHLCCKICQFAGLPALFTPLSFLPGMCFLTFCLRARSVLSPPLYFLTFI